MIYIFVISLFSTLIITRTFAHILHDRKNYGTPNEKSKTLTHIIRKKTGLDIHHIHIGIFLLIIILPIIFLSEINYVLIILLGVSISLILDQLTPVCNKNFSYFDKKRVLESILLHAIVAIIAIRIL